MTTESKPTAEAAAAPTVAQMLIGGEAVDAADGQTFDVVDPGHGPDDGHGTARRARGRRSRRRRGPQGVRRPQGLGQLGGRQARPEPLEARRPHQEEQRGAGPAREPQRRQADHRGARRGHRREPRLRLLRGCGEQAVRPDDPGQQARPRPDPARADRRRRADRAVELPDPDGLVEGRAGPGRRQHRDPQARVVHAAHRDPPRRAGPGGRHPGRRPQHRDGPRRHGRRVDRGPRRASARSRSPARRRPARRSCGWRRAT